MGRCRLTGLLFSRVGHTHGVLGVLISFGNIFFLVMVVFRFGGGFEFDHTIWIYLDLFGAACIMGGPFATFPRFMKAQTCCYLSRLGLNCVSTLPYTSKINYLD